MRAPYKYPYISIFIIGYYLLEHQGYYYKLRKYLGYKEVDEIDYIVHLDPEKFNKIASGANRKVLLYTYTQPNDETASVFNKTAMKAKEKQRSPIIFSDMDCLEHATFCSDFSSPGLHFFIDKSAVSSYAGPFTKKKILKFLRNANSTLE